MMQKRDKRKKKRGELSMGKRTLNTTLSVYISNIGVLVFERQKTIRTALSKKHDLSGTVLKNPTIY